MLDASTGRQLLLQIAVNIQSQLAKPWQSQEFLSLAYKEW